MNKDLNKDFIPKRQLEHGAYYFGSCRNANIARWDGKKEHFVHWRTKFAAVYTETIHHPEDENIYDVFYPTHRITEPKPIPLEEDESRENDNASPN